MDEIIDNLQQLLVQLSKFDSTIPIVVRYDKRNNTFSFYQFEKVFVASSINNIHLPVKFEFSFLFPSDLIDIINSIDRVVSEYVRNKNKLILISPINGGFVLWNRSITLLGEYKGPTQVATVRLYSMTNRVLIWLVANFYSKELKKFFKQIKSIKWK